MKRFFLSASLLQYLSSLRFPRKNDVLDGDDNDDDDDESGR